MSASRIEQQLQGIQDKAALRKWVDSLPDDVPIKGIVIIDETRSADEEAHYSFREIGGITVIETFYMLDSYKHYILNGGS